MKSIEKMYLSWTKIGVQHWRLLRFIIVQICHLKYLILHIQKNHHFTFSPSVSCPFFLFFLSYPDSTLSWYETVYMQCILAYGICECTGYICAALHWFWFTSCSALGYNKAAFNQARLKSKEFRPCILP